MNPRALATALVLAILAALAAAVPAQADRLDDAAAGLRQSPLYVDPELGWTLDAAERQEIVRTLRTADVPILLAVLPRLDADESGGDEDRTIRGLQDRLRRDAVYVLSDERGDLELRSMGIPRYPGVPYDVLSAGVDERPGALNGLVGRVGEVVRHVVAGEPAEPRGPVDDLEPLRPANEPYRASSGGGSGLSFGGDVVAPFVVGAVLGLTVVAIVIAAMSGVRAAKRGPDA
ncbi:hypothetical protein [Patulibacter sp. SYSU D01012]|uniref:hypothetical protein n=1 Tax=Patulibacter sp. SYSU D01012 TaxID=2817381 RepID=UPI001B3148D5|nr:hypothetical protein [Patulibacter sp. SYSU D01012]